jgi:hypothetical protein
LVPVTLSVSFQLWFPEIQLGFRHACTLASRVLVPHATMDEYGDPSGGENQIWTGTGNALAKPIPQAGRMEELTDSHLLLSVAALDTRHPLRAFRLGQCVRQTNERPRMISLA